MLQTAMPVQALTPQISAGNIDGFAVLDANGVIWTTGNAHANSFSSQPVRFQSIADAKWISMGSGTFWIIRADDSLWGTGSNTYGELGTGNPGSTITSQPIKVLDNVRQVVEQGASTYAVRTDGSLWAWGRNNQAQLGLGDQLNRSVPTPISGLSNVVQVAAGAGTHAIVLTADGNVWAMGICCAELGLDIPGITPDDPRFYQSTPQLIPGMDNMVAIAAASGQTFMVRADGTLWALGGNFTGGLGLGEVGTNVSTPRQVQTLIGVTAVTSNAGLSLALLQDGTVWGWGANINGQLGGLGRANESAPIKLTFLSDVATIAGSSGSGFALLRDGSIVSWGRNFDGSLGRGAIDVVLPSGLMAGPGGAGTFNAYAAAPATVNQLPSINLRITTSGDQAPVTVTVNVGAADSDGTVASIRLLTTDGQSASISGTSGTATFQFNSIGTYRVDAIAVDNQGGATVVRGYPAINVKPPAIAINTGAKIRAGAAPIVLNSRGEVRAWGVSGLVGDALWLAYAPNPPPEFLTYPYDPRISTVVGIEATPSGKFAVLQSGQVLAWGGLNTQGALGLASGTPIPTLVPALSGIVQVAGGWSHSLALDSQGRIYATGANDYGQLGFGDQIARTGFTLLQTPTNVTQIAAGEWASYALDSGGQVWAWGRNSSGEMGNGNTTDMPSPQAVTGLPPIATICSAAHGAFAIARDGTVWGWGGVPLPDGGGNTPRLQPSLSGAIKISAYYAVAMLKADGTVWTWGSGNVAPLAGDGTITYRIKPVIVPALTNVVDVSMSYQNALALRADGTVVSWGNNGSGQIGDGTFALRPIPVAVVNENADGYLNLNPGTSFELPPSVGVPFFVVASGSVANVSASVNTTTKFNTSDVGKSGAVFVTAAVPPGSLVPARSAMSALGASGVSASGAISSVSSADTAASSFVLIQLTSSGWQQVVNGQLIPYASGVLGDQLSAQTILNNTDTTYLKGAQFCLGYGASADQMIAVGTMRVVASIPDPNATGAAAPSCIVPGPPVSYSLALPQGWSLLGNSLNQALSVASLYGDPTTVTSVWKWDTALGWQFYTPLMDAATLQTYATGKGYGVLTTINPGEGYWVNTKASPTLAPQSGASFVLTSPNLAKGWNLAATGIDLTPSAFNANLKASLPGTGVTTLWAWDNTASQWYFYAPSLETQGGTALSDYITSKNYLDFTQRNKTLGNGTGFWVNR
jgi:alpha-tubulin suppressor-like RCC1 family protein